MVCLEATDFRRDYCFIRTSIVPQHSFFCHAVWLINLTASHHCSNLHWSKRTTGCWWHNRVLQKIKASHYDRNLKTHSMLDAYQPCSVLPYAYVFSWSELRRILGGDRRSPPLMKGTGGPPYTFSCGSKTIGVFFVISVDFSTRTFRICADCSKSHLRSDKAFLPLFASTSLRVVYSLKHTQFQNMFKCYFQIRIRFLVRSKNKCWWSYRQMHLPVWLFGRYEKWNSWLAGTYLTSGIFSCFRELQKRFVQSNGKVQVNSIRRFFQNSDLKSAFKNTVHKTLRLLSRSYKTNVVDEIYNFEKQLAKVCFTFLSCFRNFAFIYQKKHSL